MESVTTKTLYEKYGFLIQSRCLKILGNEDEADDGIQDIILKLVKQYPKFKNSEHIVPWILTVVKNYCLNKLKTRKKFIDNKILLTIPTKQDRAESFETREIINMVLTVHNKKVQDAVYYTYIEGLSQEEIRDVTGVSPATTRRYLKKFKDSLPAIRKRFGLK